MYMAFVMDIEDIVKFYIRTPEGEYKVITHYIERGDSERLQDYIKCYMFPQKKKKKKAKTYIDPEGD